MMRYVDPNMTYPPITATAVMIEKGESQPKTPPVYFPSTMLSPQRTPPKEKPWLTAATRLPNPKARLQGLFPAAWARNSKETARKISPTSMRTRGRYRADITSP